MRAVLGALLLSASLAAGAAPHVPKDDATVLERLPAKPNDPAMAALRRMRAALADDPSNAELASQLANRYFEMASAEGDPRYVGYAEAALQPWRERAAPTEVVYVRALVRQYRHDFAGALADLDTVLKAEPDHVGAHAWR